MARTLTEAETQVEPSSPRQAAGDRRQANLANRVPTAYRLTDEDGHCAYLWWEDNPVVDTGDPAFRRRILRALKKPIWAIEDVPDEQGFALTTRVLLEPDDPRYPSRLVWRWDQVGLGNLASIGLVRRHDRATIETLWGVDAEDSDG